MCGVQSGDVSASQFGNYDPHYYPFGFKSTATEVVEGIRLSGKLQFATNHLGHFALALGLHRALAAAGNARIVVVSSTGHLLSPVVFDDIHFDFRSYDP